MYGHPARKAIIAAMMDSPELGAATFPEKAKARIVRQLADRLLIELWMRGFAVSARQPGPDGPTEAPEAHAAWRAEKIARKGQKAASGLPRAS